MSERRVVVTGVGFACPQGVGSADVFEKFVNGENAIHDEAYGHPVGLVNGLDPVALFDSKKEARRTDKVTHYAIAAADEALQHAGLEASQVRDPSRAGVMLGVSGGGVTTLLAQHDVLREKGPRRVSPFVVPMHMNNASSAHLSMRYGFTGMSSCVSTACASGGNAIGDAALAIKTGAADLMIAGGTEGGICELVIAGFSVIHALTRECSRPFDADRDGFVYSNGAAMLILEERESAQARGARPLCEVSGYGRTIDAYHITAPHPAGKGASRAIELALADAQLNPSDVGYVNAHGTSTPLNDVMEATAVRRVFGADTPPMSSVKSMVGHLIGAAGALEGAVTAMALAQEVLPPTINFHKPDPEIDLDIVPNEAREAKGIEAAISNSFAFGGHNVVLAFRRV